ncbi:MAG: LacI family DNA-binding transcriptional regulator [Candidatus Goldbacteria bacterium]|nr:LacI family DNA-binding transcriptional regulator [Candidatus Goldiibacteriota bacterium]
MDYEAIKNGIDIRGKGTNNIVVVKPAIYSVYEMNILRSIESYLIETEKNLVVYTAKNQNEVAKSLMMDIAEEKKADGVITINVKPDAGLVDAYKRFDLPLVMIDGGIMGGVNCINIDDFQSGYKAAEYLIKKGRRRIVVTAGDPRYGYSQDERIKGCRKAFYDFGIPESRFEILDLFLYSREDGLSAFTDVMNFRPDAVFCANGDYFASGLLEQAKENGFEVPEKIAVIGHDDTDLAETMKITTMRQPASSMGEKAMEVLFENLSGKNTDPVNIVYQTELVERGTA